MEFDMSIFNQNINQSIQQKQFLEQKEKTMEINIQQLVQQNTCWKDVALEIYGKNIKAAVDLASDILIREYPFKTMLDNEEIWFYYEGYYRPVGEAVIKDIIQKQQPIKEVLSSNFVNEVIASVKRKSYIEREQFEADLNLICVNNGVYNLKTRVLEQHSPKHYFKNKIKINFNPEATCPNILNFIEETVEPKYKQTAKEIFAFNLYRQYFIQKAIMLTGTGQNGKSIYLDLLTRFVGEDNCSHEQLQGICHSQFSAAELYGKLANICGDLPAVILENTGNFKQLTSGLDSISAQKKFMNPFNYKNSAKLIFSANEIPETKDQTEAFFRRWLIIDFPYKFVSGLNDEEYTGFLKKEDKSIIDKLVTKEELEGLLLQSLSLLHELLSTKSFTNQPKTEEIKKKYNLKSDSSMVFVESFIDDENEERNGEEIQSYVEKEHLYKQYVLFCEDKGVNYKNPQAFFRTIKERWNPGTEKKLVSLGIRKNCFIGIRYLGWKND